MTRNDNKDEVFKGADAPASFRFDSSVARVFDDMIVRSVPGYQQAQQLIAGIGAHFAQSGSQICDLGCSTGNTLRLLDPLLTKQVSLLACDSSGEMLEKCRQNLNDPPLRRKIRYHRHDLNTPVGIHNSSVVIASLVLQFLNPPRRIALLAEIFDQLNRGGALIVFEKCLSPHPLLQQAYVSWHEDFKRQRGYSDLEIARKKQALENVLVPLSMSDNLEMLKQAGFSRVEVFFCLANFFAAVAVKNP